MPASRRSGRVAAAIANAIFDATGVRIRRVPFSPDRVKSALQLTIRPARDGRRCPRRLDDVRHGRIVAGRHDVDTGY